MPFGVPDGVALTTGITANILCVETPRMWFEVSEDRCDQASNYGESEKAFFSGLGHRGAEDS